VHALWLLSIITVCVMEAAKDVFSVRIYIMRILTTCVECGFPILLFVFQGVIFRKLLLYTLSLDEVQIIVFACTHFM